MDKASIRRIRAGIVGGVIGGCSGGFTALATRQTGSDFQWTFGFWVALIAGLFGVVVALVISRSMKSKKQPPT